MTEAKWYATLKPRFAGKIPSENEKWALSDETKAKISATFAAKIKDIECSYCKNTFRAMSRETCNGTCRKRLKRRELGLPEVPPRKAYTRTAHRKEKETKIEVPHPCLQCGNDISARRKFCNKSCIGGFYGKKESLPKEKLEELYTEQELSSTDIAKMMNVSAPTVRKWLRDFEIPVRNRAKHTARTLSKISKSGRKSMDSDLIDIISK